MEYLNLLLKNPVERLGLGDPNRPESRIDEATICSNFNDFSTCITITLKGSYRLRNLENNLQKQYEYFTRELLPVISEYCSYYYVVPELHKCQQWLHFHGILTFKKMSYNVKLRRTIYEKIDKPLKKGMSYKTRILLEKVYDVNKWVPYLLKEQPLMEKLNPLFVPKYKLIRKEKFEFNKSLEEIKKFTVNL